MNTLCPAVLLVVFAICSIGAVRAAARLRGESGGEMNYLRWCEVHSAIAGANLALLVLLGFGTRNLAVVAVGAFAVGISLTMAGVNFFIYYTQQLEEK